jgi:hypothetical protein
MRDASESTCVKLFLFMSSPSHVWLFGNDSSTGPYILSHS